jgi:hypothetical protein
VERPDDMDDESFTLNQLRALDVLARVREQLTEDAERFYSGPLARDHAANQADRELEEALLSLVRNRRGA